MDKIISRGMVMKTFLLLCIILSLTLLACQAGPATARESSSGDPLTGTWQGDFGDGYFDRNTISLDLKWDGTNLSGMVRPGDPHGRMYRNFTPFEIQKASFDPATHAIKFEALFEPRSRAYVIEGKVNGDAMSGTWDRPTDRRSGDFKLTRKKAD